MGIFKAFKYLLSRLVFPFQLPFCSSFSVSFCFRPRVIFLTAPTKPIKKATEVFFFLRSGTYPDFFARGNKSRNSLLCSVLKPWSSLCFCPHFPTRMFVHCTSAHMLFCLTFPSCLNTSCVRILCPVVNNLPEILAAYGICVTSRFWGHYVLFW